MNTLLPEYTSENVDKCAMHSRQTAYRQRVFERYRNAWRGLYDKSGKPLNIHAGDSNILTRGLLWGCQPFLSGTVEDIALANRIIERVHLYPCHFCPPAILPLLLHHRDRLTEKSRQRLERYLAESVPFMQGSDMRFRGYNDTRSACG